MDHKKVDDFVVVIVGFLRARACPTRPKYVLGLENSVSSPLGREIL